MDQETLKKLAESKNKLTNENAYDMLVRSAELAEKIRHDINETKLTQVLIIGVLEVVKLEVYNLK